MSVAVLGAGGVGGLVAAALARGSADVTVVAREPTAEHIADHGLRLRSPLLGDLVARPAATAELTEPARTLVVAVKAPLLEPALERVRADPEVVVPLLNGIEHIDLLRARFGTGRVAAGVIRVMSLRTAPGEIEHVSPDARVDLAAADPVLRERLEPFARDLRRAGVEVRVGSDEAGVMWSKLARLCPLALATTAYDAPVGEIRSDPVRRAELDEAVDEVAQIARAEGAAIDAGEARRELESAPPQLSSSMRRDVAAGAEPELDAIAGAVLRAGRRNGLSAPTVRGLAVRVASRAGIQEPPA
ncbi:MAG: 2-dehydropantoate 2-reductase [Solirubrobacteraceae bacterium]